MTVKTLKSLRGGGGREEIKSQELGVFRLEALLIQS